VRIWTFAATVAFVGLLGVTPSHADSCSDAKKLTVQECFKDKNSKACKDAAAAEKKACPKPKEDKKDKK
jgi:hypothetical protein